MTADTFQIKRGTTAAVNAYLPAVGEPVYDITLKKFKIGDGVTLGGVESTPTNANLVALAGLTGAANKGFYFTGAGAMATFDLTAVARALLDDTTVAAQRATLSAAVLGVNNDITQITGLTTPLTIGQGGTGNATGLAASATILATSRSISITGDATWTVNFNGSANVTAAATLASVGTAGTYGQVTTDAKGRVTSGTVITPIANGGTGNATGLAATATALATSRSISTTGDATWTVNFDGTANATAAITLASVGTASTYGQVTTDAKGRVTAGTVVCPVANGGTGQATIAAAALDMAVPKLAWASYTPTVTASSGTFTSASATGKFMVQNGICHLQVVITITTQGTGQLPLFTLPFAALTGSLTMPLPAREGAINGKSGSAYLNTLSQATCVSYDATNLVTGNGAVIYVNGSYPIA